MVEELRGRLIEFVPSPDGSQADLALIEPNGVEHIVRCLIRLGGATEIGGDEKSLIYLNQQYGDKMVCLTAQGIVLKI